jgi:O-antigen ligase
MKGINRYIVLLLSFVMGLGRYDPVFGSESELNIGSILAVILILAVFFTTNVFQDIRYYKKELFLLFSVLLLLFFSSVFYGYAYYDKSVFNLKLFISIIFFWFLSYLFKNDPKLCLNSLLIFSISCTLLAVFSFFDLLGNSYEIRNGRALLFGENPNSTSARMAISILFMGYICLENPLNYGKYRFFLLLAFVPLFITILQSGSRGSLLSLLLSSVLLVFFSKIKKSTKLFIFFLFLLVISFAFNLLLQEEVMLERMSTLVEDGNIGSRGKIWDLGLDIFYNNPIIGVGEPGYFDEIKNRYSEYIDTHNLFLYFLICGGFFTLFLFLWFLYLLLKNVFYNLKKGNSLILILFIFIILVAFKTGGVLTYLIMWYMFSIIHSFDIEKLKNKLLKN